jgi:N-acetylglucosaminyl-diphospho-decaprenol L-rhamnosyltransferase
MKRVRLSVSIITVTWNSGDTIEALINAIDERHELIVVDNGSSDATCTIVRSYPRVRLIEPGSNLGFGAGCNLGATVATGSILVLINPDARPEGGAIDALADRVQESSVGVLLPALSSSIEEVRETVSGFPSPLFLVAQAFGIWKVAKRLLVRPRRRMRIPWGLGACMAMRREVFAEIGGFDETIFLYGEDMDLCRRIHDTGRDVILDTRILVSHRGNESGRQAFDPGGRATLVLQANYRFLVRFHSHRYADLTFIIWRFVLPMRVRTRPDFAALHELLRDGTWRAAEPRPLGKEGASQ